MPWTRYYVNRRHGAQSEPLEVEVDEYGRASVPIERLDELYLAAGYVIQEDPESATAAPLPSPREPDFPTDPF